MHYMPTYKTAQTNDWTGTDQLQQSVSDKRPAFSQVFLTVGRKQDLKGAFLQKSVWIAFSGELRLFPTFRNFQQLS